MKAYKKIFAGLFVVAMAFAFFSCKVEEDEDLTVSFSPATNSTVYSGTRIYLTASDSKDTFGKDVTTEIYYTLDGTDPAPISQSLENGSYVPKFSTGSTAKLYGGVLNITGTAGSTITVTARAVKTSEKGMGAKCVARYTINADSSSGSGSTDTDVNDLPGTFKFGADDDKISFLYYSSTDSSTAGSGSDVSDTGTFKYGNYDHCQYQIQFSYSKKKWYLYTREVNGKVIEQVQSGTYTGNPWENGDVVLTDGNGNPQTVTISGSIKNGSAVAKGSGSFLLNVASVNTSIGATSDAK